MNNFPFSIWLTTLIISTLITQAHAVDTKLFSLNLKAEKKEDGYFFIFRLKNISTEGKRLYVQTPTHFGRVGLLTMYQQKEIASISTTTYSPITYSGFVLSAEEEYEFTLKFVEDNNGAIYCPEIDHRLSLFENKPKIAARCVLYVSDFGSNSAKILAVESNFISIDFNHRLTPFPPPPVKLPDYSKLPPLHK